MSRLAYTSSASTKPVAFSRGRMTGGRGLICPLMIFLAAWTETITIFSNKIILLENVICRSAVSTPDRDHTPVFYFFCMKQLEIALELPSQLAGFFQNILFNQGLQVFTPPQCS